MTLGTCGASCVAWAGAGSGPSGWLPSATSRRSPAGSPRGLAGDQGNAHTRKAWLWFLDESAGSLTPPVRRTWAPRGVTPVLGDRQRHRPKVSMVGVLCYRPDGSAARLLVGFHRGSSDTATLVKVLTGLHAFLGGAPVNLVWDNLKAHKSTAMGEFLADQDWLQVDYLPASAPALNPVEGLWANLKGGELANRCCQTAEEVIATAQDGHDPGPPGSPAAAVVLAAYRPDPMNPRSERARSGR